MNKRIIIIIIIGIIVLAAGAAVLLFLHPVQRTRDGQDLAYNDAWKLERIQGSWASEDEKYELRIDGYDCTLKIDGVYAMLASIQFGAADEYQDGSEQFTLQFDPSSVMFPDTDRGYIDALWYEDGMIYMHLYDDQDTDNAAVCLLQIEASQPKPWPYN